MALIISFCLFSLSTFAAGPAFLRRVASPVNHTFHSHDTHTLLHPQLYIQGKPLVRRHHEGSILCFFASSYSFAHSPHLPTFNTLLCHSSVSCLRPFALINTSSVPLRSPAPASCCFKRTPRIHNISHKTRRVSSCPLTRLLDQDSELALRPSLVELTTISHATSPPPCLPKSPQPCLPLLLSSLLS